jgi:hypothetical protein
MQKSNFQVAQIEAPSMFSLTLVDDTATAEANIVRGMKVFRVGTHTDSLGRKRNWTAEDLTETVKNFNALVASALPDVPVRLDHTQSIKDVVGYFKAMSFDGTFLLADVEFTEPDALAKWQRRTFRSKSIEIGTYESGDGTRYSPVALGLAFVDIPAVEGLFRHPSAPQGAPANGDKSPAADPPATHQGATMTKPNENEPGGTPPTPPAPATHQAPALPLQVFRVGGQEVSDFAAVQAHISRLETENTALETFRAETIESGRMDFVKGLQDAKKIAGPQVEQFQTLAKTMSPEQFEQFKKGWEAAPALNIFGKHDTSGAGPDGAPADPKLSAEAEIETLEEIVANHRRRGASEDEVSRMASFKKLQSLKSNG